MAFLYGKERTRQEIMQRVGDITQIAGATSARLDDGRADGTRIVEVRTGSGLRFTVIPGRGMDICSADYCGYALSFVSKTGIVHPSYYETDYDGFHRSFFAGLLTTCGLRNIGAPCEDQGEQLGLHGRLNNIPAEQVSVSNVWQQHDLVMRVSGMVRESKLYGENMVLWRDIETRLGSNEIKITDRIENQGFVPQPLTLLYHCNFGFPLLDETSRLYFPDGEVRARDHSAQTSVEWLDQFEAPQPTYPETVFYHQRNKDKNGNSYAAIFNPDLHSNGLGVVLCYNANELPYLSEWKNMAQGDYVTALEPGNCFPEGRINIRNAGMLNYLAPGETKETHLSFLVVTSRQEMESFFF